MEPWMFIAAGCFLVAGVSKGTLGVGLPIAAVGLMTMFIDARLAVALMVFPIMLTNIWQIHRSGNAAAIARRYWLFALVLPVCLLITTGYTTRVSADILVALVGLVIVLFAVINLLLRVPPIPDRLDRPAQVIGGFLAGVIGGFTAIWSPPVAAYLIARGVEKDEFVGGTGFLFFIGSLPLCYGFWQNGMLSGPVATVSAAMIVPTLVGFSIGEVIRRRIDSGRFKTIVLVFFLLIGLNLIRRGMVGQG